MRCERVRCEGVKGEGERWPEVDLDRKRDMYLATLIRCDNYQGGEEEEEVWTE